MVCEGSILSGCLVRNSIIGRNVKIHSFAEVIDSIVFDDVEIGQNARINRAIIDKNVKIAEGVQIGAGTAMTPGDHFLSPGGIAIPKQPRFDADIAQIRI